MKPMTSNQALYSALLNARPAPQIVFGIGPAGTGKTLMASSVGAYRLSLGHVKRLIITRPAVSVDEEHGFLPGSLENKMEPWTRPVFDALSRFYTQKQIKDMMVNNVIEICPMAYMRGRTFDDSWIIADEMQNSTPNQMKMVLTRIGKDSKLVVTGDVSQCESGFSGENNGLVDFMQRLRHSDFIKTVTFDESDIHRSEVVKEVLRYYL